ncbi:MAG: polysaccharide deacetylase family protein [Calditrichia bacterium]
MKRSIILMYHIIDKPLSDVEARYCCTQRQFERQMRFLKESNYRVISLDNLVDGLGGKSQIPENAVVVTFDDGFESSYYNALPVLTRYNIPATMFIVSDRVGSSNDWMLSRGFPHRKIMSWSQLRELTDAGICLGSHTQNHPDLTELSNGSVRDEVRISKQILEDAIGKSVSYFAYPYGLFNQKVQNAVEEAGYRAACSTRSGFNGCDIDHFALRRIAVYGGDSLWKFSRKIKFGTNEMNILFPATYYSKRLVARLGLTG